MSSLELLGKIIAIRVEWSLTHTCKGQK
jgi:hypothetical protein